MIMSSDASSASYGLDDTGINIHYVLKDFTPNSKVNINPFIADLSHTLLISEYSTYNMVALNRTAITSYNCDIKNSNFNIVY